MNHLHKNLYNSASLAKITFRFSCVFHMHQSNASRPGAGGFTQNKLGNIPVLSKMTLHQFLHFRY